MATQLPIVKIDGKHYYQDDRLMEFREVTNFLNRIKFEDLGDRVPKPILEKSRQVKQRRIR